ncbi:hypothetical protein H9L25_00550 [Terrisporobacter mayombei]|nr:hypothetical protein [Terrisporobacter mayombei]
MIRTDIKLLYEFQNNIFRIGDICEVKIKNKFNNETYTYKGKILFPTIADTLEMDVSSEYSSQLVTIDLDDILEWELVRA